MHESTIKKPAKRDFMACIVIVPGAQQLSTKDDAVLSPLE